MDRGLLSVLADPEDGTPLELVDALPDQDVATGGLAAPSGASYSIRNGIPRFVASKDDDQARTADTFGFKWARADSYDSEPMRAAIGQWLVSRYGFESLADMRTHLERSGRVADLGCGSGFSTSLWMDAFAGDLFVGVDISSAIDVAKERLGGRGRTEFVQADVLKLPFCAGTFDAVISEGVFHHTPSTRSAILSAARILRPGGELLFYVYRTKAPVREFTDDYVRDLVSAMPPEEAWEAMRPLTRLGQSLAELHAEIEVPEAIEVLGIAPGRYDVQRLIFYNFAKLFWNDTYTFEENLHINFDWYHPRYSHRQTETEVREWCAEANVEITLFDNTDPSGFTVRGRKRSDAS